MFQQLFPQATHFLPRKLQQGGRRVPVQSHTPDRASGYKAFALDKRNPSLVAMLLYPTIVREKRNGAIVRRYKGDI